jgi:polyhydroxyalkanoate synthesis regulator phasin
MKMFDQEKMAQTVFNLAKDYTTTTMQMMKTSMEQYEKTVDTMLKQGLVAQEEGQKLLSDWTNRAKQGQQQYWNLMDENMKKMESFFNPDGQKRATK